MQAKYDRKRARALAKAERQHESIKKRQIKVKVFKKDVKIKPPTEAKMKSKALAVIQKYAKLSRAERSEDNILVFVIDK